MNCFCKMMALTDKDGELAPREFHLPATTDWREISMLFNSLDAEKVRVYAGFGVRASAAKFWLDD